MSADLLMHGQVCRHADAEASLQTYLCRV